MSILVDGLCRGCGQIVLGLKVEGPGPWVEIGIPCPFNSTHQLVVDIVWVEGGDLPAPEPVLTLERTPVPPLREGLPDLPGVSVGEPAVVRIPPASGGAAGFALSLGLDPAHITPTGPAGELTFEDLERAYQENLAARQPGG